MKKKIRKILGVGLAFMLVLSLMMFFAPVAVAADYEENDWGEWGLPSIDEGTDVGPMAVAPDGTIYAAVYDGSDWMVQKSEDGGFDWDDTELDDAGDVIVQIVVSPNYDDDETIYVACYDGTIYRLEETGDANPIALRAITGVTELFSIDVWSDDDDNWILAGTEDGVFEIVDAHGGDWIDYQLPTPGYEVAFAPDFDEIEIIWALTDDGGAPADFVLTSTIAPGQWGQVIADAPIDVGATVWADMDFPDDYSSDVQDEVPLVFLALTDGIGTDGGVYMVEGVEVPGTSVATALETTEDMVSLAVSGEIILAGAQWSPEIYISDDLGASWDDVDKMPTGNGWTHVYMAPGDFDPDDGVAYASTFGDESAFSRSEDGGEVWNQTGIIDTYINEIDDIAFHPDFPGTPTYLMTTDNRTSTETDSIWLTTNGDEDEPDYYRVLAGYDGAPGNFAANKIRLVEFSQDGDAIYIFGLDDDWDSSIWKSTDDGQTFGKKRGVAGGGVWINDWVIPDSSTIYAATDGDGFAKSINSGLSWSTTEVDSSPMNDIALSPDFDDGEGFIALGGSDGEVYLSDNEGDGFDETDAGLTDDDVFVAFDADFADEDADGYMLIYAAGQDDDVMVGEVDDTDDVDWDPLEDDENDATQGVFATGLQVAADNALYVMGSGTIGSPEVNEADGTLELTDGTNSGTFNIPDTPITGISGDFEDEESLTISGYTLAVTGTNLISGTISVEGNDSEATGTVAVSITVSGWLNVAVTVISDDLWAEITGAVADEDTGVFRLLLHESDSEWESASDGTLDDPMGLWLSLGSNVLWTIDGNDAELWVLEDTLSGAVTLDSPPDGSKLDRLEVVRIAWDELRGADDDYEYRLNETSGLGTDIDGFTDDTDINVSVTGSSEYDWKVRVAPGEPWHSRWSDEWTFNTALGAAPWAPTLYTPGGTWQYSGLNVELMPAFSWESAKSADGYQFVLADNAEFTSPLVNEKAPESAYNLDFELEYNTNYFWRVMAYKGNDAISRWSDIGAFTTIKTPAPAPPAPAPPATVTQPAPAPIVLPTPIPPALLWVIIGIGAALIIAVIVLIVRTRRPV